MQSEQLKDIARHAYDRELTKQNLKVAMASRLSVSYNGGNFVVTPELMSFLNLWSEDIVILDSYDIPIKIKPQELLITCKQRYNEVLNEWHDQYEKQSKIRTAKDF